MTTKIIGVIAAGFLAIGIVVGAAATIVARDDASTHMADQMRGTTSMMGAGSMDGMPSMMGAGSMDGMPSMMSLMGTGSPMTPSASMRPDASMSPGDHESHHASPDPVPTR
jgi:predicted DNA repair protein MutK